MQPSRQPSPLSRRRFLAAASAEFALGGLALALALSPGTAEAKLPALPRPLPPSSEIGSGTFVPAPTGWLQLVKRIPALDPAGATLCCIDSQPQREAELVRAQRQVNGTMRFRKETGDLWQLASMAGDCEDFAIRKLVILTRQFGWPRGALTLATCKAETGEGHAVLLAHTKRGTYVLDNRRAPVLPWRDLPYSWRAREEPGAPFSLWRALAT